MTPIGWLQILLFCALVLLLVRPLGGYMTRLFSGERTLLNPVLGPVERGLYRLSGIDPGKVDGIFGPILHSAVAAFQAREGLTVAGVVGPETAAAVGLSWPIPG